MSQSLCKIYLHIIFHIKSTSPLIIESHWSRLHSYIGELINSTGCQTIRVGGVSDHVHVVCILSRNENVAHLVEELKRNSSRWIKKLSPNYHRFAWQGGYAVFSVSESVVGRTVEYVKDQREHHRKRTFQEEYKQFLQLYHIKYDEKYLFND